MALERGTLLNNRYRIGEILGQGGMGSVYRAIDENLGVEVAVKENLFTTEDYARQFRREANILASLRHPNLPRVTDHFVIEGEGQYLVMDYIEGEDLRQRMDRIGVISEEEAIIIGAAICDALTFLHSRTQPIVHRDIKPGNVKITPNGHIFLVDFGLAKILEGSQVTTTGARAMTPGYSPPEQYGTARTDHRSDIFSLGATLYAALTGAIPEDALARAMEQVELTTIRKRNPKISRRLASVLERSLEIRPDSRYQTAEELKLALLSARNITRQKTGEYKVEPPPDGFDHKLMEGYAPYSPGLSSESAFNLSTPTPLPDSQSAPRRFPARRARSRRSGGCLLAALVSLLFVGGGTFLYASNPSLPVWALARFLPAAPASPTVTVSPPTRTPAPAFTLIDAQPTERSTLPAELPSPALPTPTATATAVIMSTATNTATYTATPSYPGGGLGKIAFASDRTGANQIYMISADGSGERMLTELPDGACQPDWAPDGIRLVFISPCPRNQDLYQGSGLFLLDTSEENPKPMPLTKSPGGDFDPAWSPDGTKIAFTSLRVGGRPRIYIHDFNNGQETLISMEYSRDVQPAWSPDGKMLAFVSLTKGSSEIWVMDNDGQNPRPLSHSPSFLNSHPAWSPDGGVIMFTQVDKPGRIPRLVAVYYGSADENEYQFNIGTIPVREASYSPDGLWLVVESWPKGGDHDIYLIAANGANRTALTDDPRIDFDPDWSP